MWRQRVGRALGHDDGKIPDWDVLVPQIKKLKDRMAINGVSSVNPSIPGSIRKKLAIALGNELSSIGSTDLIPDWNTLIKQAEKLVETINGGLGKWVEELRVALEIPADARTTWADLMRQVKAMVDEQPIDISRIRMEWRNQLAAALGMDLTNEAIPDFGHLVDEVKDMREIPRTDHSHVDCNASFNELRRRSEWLIERAKPDPIQTYEWTTARNNWRRRYGVEGPVLGDKHPKPMKGQSTALHEAVEHTQSTLKYIHVRTSSGINLPGPTVNIHQAIEFYVLENEDLVIEDSSGPIATYKHGHWDTVMVAPEGSDIYALECDHDPADTEPTSTVDGFGRMPWERTVQTISDPVPPGLVADIQSAIADADMLPKNTKACRCGWAIRSYSTYDSMERVWTNENCPVHVGR
jgi:hypothetical protein